MSRASRCFTLFGDPLADVPSYVRAQLRPDVVGAPAPGSAAAHAALQLAGEKLAADRAASDPRARRGGPTVRRDGTPRHTAETRAKGRGSKGAARALVVERPAPLALTPQKDACIVCGDPLKRKPGTPGRPPTRCEKHPSRNTLWSRALKARRAAAAACAWCKAPIAAEAEGVCPHCGNSAPAA